TIPSSPILQAWAKKVGPSPSICSLNRMSELALATIDASAALRTSSGSRRRSSPFDEVEGVEEYAVVSALVTDEIERGHAVVIAGDSFAVDNTGARAQACQRLDDQREAAGGIVARTAVEAHPRALPCGRAPETPSCD